MNFASFHELVFQTNQNLSLSWLFAGLIEILSSLQIAHLIIETITFSVSSPQLEIKGLIKSIPYFTGSFRFNLFYDENSLYLSIWFIFAFYLSFFILTYLLVLFVVSRKKNLNMRFLKAFGVLNLLHSRIFFFPIQYFLFNLISLYRKKNLTEENSFYREDGWMITTIILIMANNGLALIKEFAFCQINQSKNYYDVKTNIYHQIIILLKSIAIFLIHQDHNHNTWALKTGSVFHLLVLTVLLVKLYTDLPFYKFQMLKLSVVLTSILFCFALTSIISIIITNDEVLKGIQFVFILKAAFAAKIGISQLQLLFEKIAKGNYKSPQHAIHFVLLWEEFNNDLAAYKNLKNSTSNNIHVILNGMLEKVYLNFEETKENKTEQEFTINSYLIQELEQKFSENSKSQLLLVFMAEFYLDKFRNTIKALELVKKIESTNLSFIMITSLRQIYQKLKVVYAQEHTDAENRLNFSNYFNYYSLTNKLKENMLLETSRHLEFWNNLQKPVIDAKALLNLTQGIDKLFSRVKHDFQMHSQGFANNFKLANLLYGIYSKNVRQNPLEASRYIMQFQKQYYQGNSEDRFDIASGSSAVVIVSLDKAKIGQILYASGSIESLFHFQKKDLIGKRIESIFPTFIAMHYQNYIQQYAKNPSFKLDLTEETYGKTLKDDIFELEVQFQGYPFLNKEITIMIFLKKISDPLPALIVDHEGAITDCSNMLKKSFQGISISLQKFKQIQNVLPNLERALTAINQVYRSEEEDKKIIKDYAAMNSLYIESASRALIGKEREMTEPFNILNSPSRIEYSSEPSRSIRTRVITRGLDVKAKEISENLTGGKRIFLGIHNTPSSKQCKVSAEIQIKPYVIDSDVYKVIIMNKVFTEILSIYKNEDEDEDDIGDDERASPNELFSSTEKRNYKAFHKSKTSLCNKNHNVNLENKEIEQDTASIVEILEEDQQLNEIAQLNFHEDDQRSSIVNSIHRESRVVSTIRQLTMKKKIQRSLFFVNIGIAMCLLLLFTLSIVNSGQSINSIQDIGNGIQTVYSTTLRFQATLNAWMWAQLLITASFPVENVTPTLKNEIHKLSKLNNEIKLLISKSTKKNQISEGFDKNIHMYELTGQGIQLSSVMDTFTANDYIVQKYLPLAQITSYVQLPQFDDIPFTFNNTANDYLVSTENLITQKIHYLSNIIREGLNSLEIIMSIELALIIIMTVLFIVTAVTLSRGYERLCRALIKTPEKSVLFRIDQLEKVKTLLGEDLETKAFIGESYHILNEVSKEKAKGPSINNRHSRNKNYTLKSMHINLTKAIILPILMGLGFIGFFVSTTVRSHDTYNTLASYNEEISILSDGTTQSSLLLSSLMFQNIFRTIPFLRVRNQSPNAQIEESFKKFETLNARMSSKFLNTPKKVDPFIEEILQRDVCGNLVEGKGQCLVGSNFVKSGLMQFNTQYYLVTEEMYIGTGSLDFASAIALFSAKIPKLIFLIMSLVEIYPILITHVVGTFEIKKGEAEHNEMIFAVITCLLITVYTVFVFLKPIRDLRKIDLGRRKILKLLPFHLFQENKTLKFYLVQNFKKEIGGVKNIL